MTFRNSTNIRCLTSVGNLTTYCYYFQRPDGKQNRFRWKKNPTEVSFGLACFSEQTSHGSSTSQHCRPQEEHLHRTMCYTLFWVINMFITCLIFKTTLGTLSILLIRKLRHRHLVVCPKVPWVIDDGAKFLPVILLCSKNTELRERSPGFLVLALLLVTAMTPKT